MLTQQEFEKLGERVARGKAWIKSKPGGFGSDNPYVIKAIDIWFDLSHEWLEEAVDRKTFDYLSPTNHSRAWNLMKQNDALEKWKQTRVALRGPDPRTLPLESFI